jgi:hypothetical protein
MFRLLAILLILTAQALPVQAMAAWCTETDSCACCASTCPCLEADEEPSTPQSPPPLREPTPRWQILVPSAWEHRPTDLRLSFANPPHPQKTDPPGFHRSGPRQQAWLGVFLH